MEFCFKSFYNIDHERNAIIYKALPDDFDIFLVDYINFASQQNKNVKNYKVRDKGYTVVNALSKIVKNSCDKQEGSDVLSETIAKKLLDEENAAQETIARMGKRIRKGSILQAAIREAVNTWLFVVAKVEHTEYYSGETLSKNYGWPSEQKSVWKSAVFRLGTENIEPEITSIQVYTDNIANYWADKFLELDEVTNDEFNTSQSYCHLDSALKSLVKKESPRDYEHLRGAITTKYRTSEKIDYDEMINEILGNYIPENPSLNIGKVIKKAKELPNSKGFDAQFIVDLKSIKFNKKRYIDVGNGVSIAVAGDAGDILDQITAYTDDGKKYIRIECTNEDTFKRFKPH